MMLLALFAAFAAEPAWVQTVEIARTNGPPDGACESKAKVASPGTPTVTPPPSASETNESESAAMVRFDTAPGAANAALPEGWAKRLQLGGAFDVGQVPLEPLRGREADIARIHAVIASAARHDHVVRLAFWGASHVAGEYMTGELRRLLQDRYGDAGHGFVMPAAPWTGYRASDVNLCSGGEWVSDFVDRRGGRADGLLGFAGVSVEGLAQSATGWVQTTKTNPHGQQVSRFEIHYLRQPGGGVLAATVDDAPVVDIPTAGTTGPGTMILSVPDGPHRLSLHPAGDGPVRIFGVVMERASPGVVVDAMGVSGRTATSWLHWDEPLMRDFLSRRTPELAVLAYGTNEANDRSLTPEEYRTNLRAVLTKFRRLLPETACLLIGPSDRAKKLKGTTFAVWGPTEWVAGVQREVGPEFGCATWDLQAVMGGPGSMLRWRAAEPTLAAGDYIHLSAAGYQEVARRLLAVL